MNVICIQPTLTHHSYFVFNSDRLSVAPFSLFSVYKKAAVPCLSFVVAFRSPKRPNEIDFIRGTAAFSRHIFELCAVLLAVLLEAQPELQARTTRKTPEENSRHVVQQAVELPAQRV